MQNQEPQAIGEVVNGTDLSLPGAGIWERSQTCCCFLGKLRWQREVQSQRADSQRVLWVLVLSLHGGQSTADNTEQEGKSSNAGRIQRMCLFSCFMCAQMGGDDVGVSGRIGLFWGMG